MVVFRRRWHTGCYPSGASLGVSAPPQWESCSRVGNGVARPLGKIREWEPVVGWARTAGHGGEREHGERGRAGARGTRVPNKRAAPAYGAMTTDSGWWKRRTSEYELGAHARCTPWRGAKLKARGRLAKAVHALRKDVTSSAFVKVSASFFLDSRYSSMISPDDWVATPDQISRRGRQPWHPALRPAHLAPAPGPVDHAH